MFSLLSLLLLAASLAATARASALTTPIAANEKLCFYADVDKAGEKIGVRPLYSHLLYIHSVANLVLFCCAYYLDISCIVAHSFHA